MIRSVGEKVGRGSWVREDLSKVLNFQTDKPQSSLLRGNKIGADSIDEKDGFGICPMFLCTCIKKKGVGAVKEN